MKISITNADLQMMPDLMAKIDPTLDVSPFKQLLQGVTFSEAGTLILAVELTPTESLTLELDVAPS